MAKPCRSMTTKAKRRKKAGRNRDWQNELAAKNQANSDDYLMAMLEGFWTWIGRWPKGVSLLGEDETLTLLQEFAGRGVRPPVPDEVCAARRRQFNKWKDRDYPLRDFPACFVCGKTPKHRHHIVSLRHGGSNAFRNLVGLCVACHESIHPFMRETATKSKPVDKFTVQVYRDGDRWTAMCKKPKVSADGATRLDALVAVAGLIDRK